MCGIFGWIGGGAVRERVRAGLGSLEYRGYDSCGYALFRDGAIDLRHEVGSRRIDALTSHLPESVAEPIGLISHTRWATHGAPTIDNAHPHTDCGGTIALVHNGIIENYQSLRDELAARHAFTSSTDTEIIPHLLEDLDYGRDPAALFARLDGSYACLFGDQRHPGRLFAFRRRSPLIAGIADGCCFVSSDPQLLCQTCDELVRLEEDQLYEIRPEGICLLPQRTPVRAMMPAADFRVPDAVATPAGPFGERSMRREIWEQPALLADAVARFREQSPFDDLFARFGVPDRVVFAGCGTSWHAALIGRIYLEEMAPVSAQVEYSSEFRYSHPVLDRHTWFIAMSQSGETADTLGAVELGRQCDAPIIGIHNAPLSALDVLVDGSIFLRVGRETAVAATKSFTAQVLALLLLTLAIARRRKRIGDTEMGEMLAHLAALPDHIEEVLGLDERVRRIAERYFVPATNALFLGRTLNYPVALEGALKMKEVSYVHAEGAPAGEMKHGPLALVDRDLPAVFMPGAPTERVYDKMLSNMCEVRSRGGRVIAVINGEPPAALPAEEILQLPPVRPELTPLVNVVALQLLAYHAGVLRGCDVDMPRNLAKSVTVE
jgi:glucosamine--fructose-6-phosphate aminotransferase (isomerizing)